MVQNIIIPSSGPGLRINSNKPKIDVEFINNTKLYEHQISILNRHFPDSVITYIVGFHADKVEKPLKELGCKVVNNSRYTQNNIPFGVNLAGRFDELLIIYGDIFFSSEFIEHLPKRPSGSFVIKDVNDNFHHKNIGVGPNGYLSYCFEQKWSQVTYFDKKATSYFNENIAKPKNHKKFTFEFVNEMNERNIVFDVFSGSGYCKEMDSIKDYNQINKWIFNNTNDTSCGEK